MKTSRIILATDELHIAELRTLAEAIGNQVYAFKIHNHYDQWGPDIVEELKGLGVSRVWVDAKLHDIPNTVKLRAAAIADSGADILTVHALGGIPMMNAAKEGAPEMTIFGITVLTSINDDAARHLFGNPSVSDRVRSLAESIKVAELHGVVCSPAEVKMLKPGAHHVKLVVPGIRSKGVDAGDQQRVGTPAQAITDGADYLVIGRQITQAACPREMLKLIEAQIAGVQTKGGNP